MQRTRAQTDLDPRPRCPRGGGAIARFGSCGGVEVREGGDRRDVPVAQVPPTRHPWKAINRSCHQHEVVRDVTAPTIEPIFRRDGARGPCPGVRTDGSGASTAPQRRVAQHRQPEDKSEREESERASRMRSCHVFEDSARCFPQIQKRVRRHGAECWTPTFRHACWAIGLRQLAARAVTLAPKAPDKSASVSAIERCMRRRRERPTRARQKQRLHASAHWRVRQVTNACDGSLPPAAARARARQVAEASCLSMSNSDFSCPLRFSDTESSSLSWTVCSWPSRSCSRSTSRSCETVSSSTSALSPASSSESVSRSARSAEALCCFGDSARVFSSSFRRLKFKCYHTHTQQSTHACSKGGARPVRRRRTAAVACAREREIYI